MPKERTLVDNVRSFIERTSKVVGQLEEERFRQEMQSNVFDVGLESPIEDLFWVSVQVLCKGHYVDVNPDPDCSDGTKEPVFPPGLYIKPQAMVGKFRVDFLLHRIGYRMMAPVAPVIVELDGHDFHDKDKKQRAYEKGRDRYFTQQGYRVMHYTGSEVVADPFKPAYEVMQMLNCIDPNPYNALDPLGL